MQSNFLIYKQKRVDLWCVHIVKQNLAVDIDLQLAFFTEQFHEHCDIAFKYPTYNSSKWLK